MQQVVLDLCTINASSTRAYFGFVLFERTIFFWKLGEVKKACFRHVSWSRQAVFFFAKFGPPIIQKTPLKLAMLFVTLESMRDSDTDFFSSLVFLQIETWLTYGWCTSVAPVSKNQMRSLQLLATWEPKIPHPQYPTPGKQIL